MKIVGGYQRQQGIATVPRFVVDYGQKPRPYAPHMTISWYIGSPQNRLFVELRAFNDRKPFWFNGTSAPIGTRWLIHPDAPDTLAASGIHDALYNRGYCWKVSTLPSGEDYTKAVPITRSFADKAMREAMQVFGTPTWKRRIIYPALRAGGRFTWNPRKDQHREALRNSTTEKPYHIPDAITAQALCIRQNGRYIHGV